MSKIVWISILVVVVLFCAIAITLFQGSLPKNSPDKIIIRVGHGHSEQHSYHKGLQRANELLTKSSNGRISIEFFPNEQLGSERQMLEMLSAGSLDMAVSAILNIFDPILSIFEFPYLINNKSDAKKVTDSILLPFSDSVLSKYDIKPLGAMEVGFRKISSNIPINKVKDLKGFRIRTPEGWGLIETFNALGAVTVPMSFPKTYEALEKGLVDGQENPLENIYDGKFYKVQKYVAVTDHIYNCALVLISSRVWNSLSKQDQGLLKEALTQGCRYQMEIAASNEKVLEQELKKLGMIFTYPDKNEFRKAALKVYDSDFYKKLEPRSSELIQRIHSLTGK